MASASAASASACKDSVTGASESLISGSESSWEDEDEKGESADEEDEDDEYEREGKHEEEGKENEEDEEDDDISPHDSWAVTATIKKAQWGKQAKWQRRMKRMLVGEPEVRWTMKRYLQAMCGKVGIHVRKNHTALEMGKLLDKRSGKDTPDGKKKTRWSAKLDSARLLGVMFGTSDMRRQFVLAKQSLTRAQIDNRTAKTPKQKYWDDVTLKFSDKNFEVSLEVNSSTVTSYVQVTKFRTHKIFHSQNFSLNHKFLQPLTHRSISLHPSVVPP